MVFGNYDVDGASATALLANFFDKINITYEIYIPDRKKGIWSIYWVIKELIEKGVN